MPFTQYIPDTAQWMEYFVKQVENRANGRKDVHSAQLGGGVAVQDESIKLTPVGPVKSKITGPAHSVDPVKVTITSPAETTVEQAESELRHIKEQDQESGIIQKRSVKRKTSSKSSRNSHSKKRKISKKYQDVFSK